MSGFTVNGMCYPDVNSAMNAWVNTYPKQDGTTVYWVSSTTPSSTGWYYVLKNGAGTQYTGNVFPMPCDDSGFSTMPIQDIAAVMGFILAFAVGVIAGKLA